MISGFIPITPMDEISKTFDVLVDAHFSSSAVSESRFHDFGKCDRTGMMFNTSF